MGLATGYYGDGFDKKATIYVFDAPPALIMHKDEWVSFEEYREKTRP